MSNPFLPLLEAGQLLRCRYLAEKMLADGAHTTHSAAQCHHALAMCHLHDGDLPGAAAHAQRAWQLAVSAGDWDLAGAALYDLSVIYQRQGRWREQADALEEFRRHLGRYQSAGQLGPAAVWSLGQLYYRMGQYERALPHLEAALAAAQALGDAAGAERCRRLVRGALLRTRRPHRVADLLRATRAYMQAHPADREAAFWHGRDRADYLLATGQPDQALQQVREVLPLAETVPAQFDCYLLLSRCSLTVGQHTGALFYAVGARICALEGERYDLAMEALTLIREVIPQVGPEGMADLKAYFAGHGVDVYRYIPESLAGAAPLIPIGPL